jgi:signal peptidase I
MEHPKENFLKEIVKFTLIAIAITFVVRSYIAGPFLVSGRSMDPTFKDKDYLIVDQLTYHFSDPQRGDPVIFRYPLDPKTFFIKRIVGLPGETVKSTDGVITIINKDHPQGIPFDDSHIIPLHKTHDNFVTTLGPTEYFVMGDNRPESSDSRFWGPVDRKFIVGRPFLRLFPPTNMAVFPGK